MELLGFSGALGREFESPRPDWLFSEGQNPPWEKLAKKYYISNTFFPTPYNPSYSREFPVLSFIFILPTFSDDKGALLGL